MTPAIERYLVRRTFGSTFSGSLIELRNQRLKEYSFTFARSDSGTWTSSKLGEREACVDWISVAGAVQKKSYSTAFSPGSYAKGVAIST